MQTWWSLIDALRIELGPGVSSRLIDVGTHNISAYDNYLLGIHDYRKLSHVDMVQAVSHLAQAGKLDPGFANAHGALGWVYHYLDVLHGEHGKKGVDPLSSC